jgi:hypothetical protein
MEITEKTVETLDFSSYRKEYHSFRMSSCFTLFKYLLNEISTIDFSRTNPVYVKNVKVQLPYSANYATSMNLLRDGTNFYSKCGHILRACGGTKKSKKRKRRTRRK